MMRDDLANRLFILRGYCQSVRVVLEDHGQQKAAMFKSSVGRDVFPLPSNID